MTQSITFLSQLGQANALKGKELTLTKANSLEIKSRSVFSGRFRGFFQKKQEKLDQIQKTATQLETVIIKEVKNRYSVTGSDDNFDIEMAISNVQTVLASLKEQAAKLSDTQEVGSLVFEKDGTLKANSDADVEQVIQHIERVAGSSIAQINRLKSEPISERAINMFATNPKDKQIRHLRIELDKVKYDLSIVPPTDGSYKLIRKEKVGLEYAIKQLEMYAPTYEQDMRNILKDWSVNLRQVDDFFNLPDRPTPGQVDKLTEIQRWKNNPTNKLPSHQKALADLEMIVEASFLVKAPIEHQAQKAIARISGKVNLNNRGNLQRFSYDFDRNPYTDMAWAAVRGAAAYAFFHPIVTTGVVANTVSHAGYLAPVVSTLFTVLPVVAPAIAAKPDLFLRGRVGAFAQRQWNHASHVAKSLAWRYSGLEMISNMVS